MHNTQTYGAHNCIPNAYKMTLVGMHFYQNISQYLFT